MKKIIISCIVLVLIIAACSATVVKVGTVKIEGSETMLIVTKRLAHEYTKEFPNVSISVEGGGTALGIRALINNDIDICTASRTIEPDEAKLLAEKYRSVGVNTYLAKDALCIYVNQSNPVQNFSLTQLKDIFTGKIKNWKEIGGNNQQIRLVIRNRNSGTFLHFKTRILEGEEFNASANVQPTFKGIIEEVEQNENAIGFGGLGAETNSVKASIDGIEPSEENIRSGRYPLVRYLHFYTLSTPSGTVKDFIDWVLSPRGQKIIEEAGFNSLFEIFY
ncbi:MAG: phosphate ABC transporter substrate-binding protein [Melioribacteraceae bacterium]